MPIGTPGLPSMRDSLSMFWAPISTRATSLIRRIEPSELARSTISPNCFAVVRRPCVCTLNWNCCSSLIGRAPIRPTGACTLCAWIALITSDGAKLRLVSRCVSNQIRIE